MDLGSNFSEQSRSNFGFNWSQYWVLFKTPSMSKNSAGLPKSGKETLNSGSVEVLFMWDRYTGNGGERRLLSSPNQLDFGNIFPAWVESG